MMLIDARLDNGNRELYETTTGGKLALRQSVAPRRFPQREAGRRTWAGALRTDAATHSYVVEKSENNRWQKTASFLVNIASCKE